MLIYYLISCANGLVSDGALMAKKSGPALTEGLSSHSHRKFLFLFVTFSSDCGCEALPFVITLNFSEQNGDCRED